MTYLQLINRFWDADAESPFSPCETRLYLLLLNDANRKGWPEGITLGTEEAAGIIGVTVPTFLKARARLTKTGFISCGQGGGRSRKVVYRITDAPIKSTSRKHKNPKTILEKAGINSKKNDTVYELNSKINTPLNFRVSERNPKTILGFTPIDIDSSYKTNNLVVEKEYYVKEKQPQKTIGELEIADATEALRGEQIWKESVCMKFRLRPDTLSDLLKAYALHCVTIGETKKTIKEAKYHFVNWLRKHQQKNADNETKRQDRFSERRGTDASALAPDDYSETL